MFVCAVYVGQPFAHTKPCRLGSVRWMLCSNCCITSPPTLNLSFCCVVHRTVLRGQSGYCCVCVTIVLLISRETVLVCVVFVSEILYIVVAGHPVFDSELNLDLLVEEIIIEGDFWISVGTSI